VIFAIEHALAKVLSAQPLTPQNCVAPQAVPHAPQWALSVLASMQWLPQQVRPAVQPLPVPSWAAVHAAAHWVSPHTSGALHSRSEMQLWQSCAALHTPLAQLELFLHPDTHLLASEQYCPSGQ
jgi:hypothetical protein